MLYLPSRLAGMPLKTIVQPQRFLTLHFRGLPTFNHLQSPIKKEVLGAWTEKIANSSNPLKEVKHVCSIVCALVADGQSVI